MEKIIEVKNLVKNYGYVKAVRDITFSVAKGEVLGFLGPNGAGKTTTMKILTCYMLPTSGEAKIAGFDIYKDSLEIRKRIGYLPETAPLYYDLQVDEFLDYVADLRGIPSNEKSNRIKEVIEVCGLKDVYLKFIGELSKGYKQRVGLAQALIHKPDILILDEPTIGLDPNQIIEIRNLIKTIGKEKTVILSTHILSEVEATCNRVIIINNGQLIADGTPSGIGRTEKGKTYILKVKTDNKDDIFAKYKFVDFIDDVKEISFKENIFQFKVFLKSKDYDAAIQLFRYTANNLIDLIEMKEEEESLEDVFHKLTK